MLKNFIITQDLDNSTLPTLKKYLDKNNTRFVTVNQNNMEEFQNFLQNKTTNDVIYQVTSLVFDNIDNSASKNLLNVIQLGLDRKYFANDLSNINEIYALIKPNKPLLEELFLLNNFVKLDSITLNKI